MGVAGAESRKRVRLEYDERRAQILAAARRVFCSRPYAEVSMTDLAAEAGVARGLLNHYFGSKRDLYLEVVRRLVEVPALPLPSNLEGMAVDEVWEAGVDGWMALIEANKDLWLTAIGAGATGRDPELEAILDESRELVAGRVLEALGLAESPPPEVWALVRGYGGFAEEVTREWLERRRLTRDQARLLLVGTMPMLVERLLPAVLATGDDGAGAGVPRRTEQPTG